MDVRYSRPGQQAVAGPIREAEIEKGAEAGQEAEAHVPVRDEQHLGAGESPDVPGDGEVLRARAYEDVRLLGGGDEGEDFREGAALPFGAPGGTVRLRREVIPEGPDGIPLHREGDMHIAEDAGPGGRLRG